MKLRKKDLYKGKLVKLNPKSYFDFIDTDQLGIVIGWQGKEVDIAFCNGTRDYVWLWNLIDPYK